ncbi:GtrA family protein [Domibacillus enclensis]|uniref:Putative flippase GtrA (Transmembrane translocase of bactoprenol-linked glucose) n=1 Tax=Domibacillus enclensis TaxID=1017273 RepID=A0A1N6XRZ6_9BACI|nr:GtrA family protein [Domibacillus enclensis]OXS77413.1 hypothetical protein B1B05_11260 [Domibacillus enclensis]SIR05102.1 Putative flippase GtrA (transmembrane translocase of bactoprenol-linked glucose) [Domibacillus enclensis]
MRNISELIKFSIVGASNTAVDLIVFFSLWFVGTPSLSAQVLSYSAGMINSFFWNRSWTFQAKGRVEAGEVLRFLSVNIAGLSISTALLTILSGQPLFISKMIATLAGMAVTFIGSRFWVFRSNRRKSI